MLDDIDRVLIDRAAIARRVAELASQITADLDDAGDGDRTATNGPAANMDITLVPILTGSFIFVADLIRHLPIRMQIRLLSVSSYPGVATTSRGTRLRGELTNLPDSLRGAHVLLVDDILDSGRTLQLAVDLIRRKQPDSVRTCVLLRKHRPEALKFPVDYVAFDIPDEFVVGYGLDFNDYYRNLPEIVTLRPQVIRDATAAAGTGGGGDGERSGAP